MELTERLYRRLLSALPHSAGGGAGEPTYTIGELYQRLIPYRAVRGEAGVLELAEYEHALLRLLSGEGGYLQVDDEEAVREIQRELASVNPILGIYRDYDLASFRLLGPTAAATRRDEPPALPPVPPAPPDGAAQPRMTDAKPAQYEAAVAPAPRAPSKVAPPVRPPAAPRLCQRCERTLPAVADLRFCPYCGRAQAPGECPACGAALDGGWSFCIRCGAGRAE
ncbi:MAG: zinc ribbon domain-containing protein [Gemmatimonadota bacterium]